MSGRTEMNFIQSEEIRETMEISVRMTGCEVLFMDQQNSSVANKESNILRIL
jgi:hypothetical protein